MNDNPEKAAATTELEVVDPVETKLVEYAGKTGLDQPSTAPLVAAFRPVFMESRKVLADAAGVAESVKDATCVTEIKRARECRLAIRRVRIAGETVRKEQKATALKYGKAVDGFYNILEADLFPVEESLRAAEETAERAEKARKDSIEAGRRIALAPYVTDPNLYPVREMTDASFAELLNGVRVAKEQAAAAAAKAEAERIAKEKADAAERERIRQENERLHREAVEREAAAKAEREAAERKLAEERAKAEAEAKAAQAKADAERAALEAKAKAEREALEAKARAEREAAEAQAAKERAAREKAEAELRAQREADEKRRKAEAAAARKAANAGDAEKLVACARAVDLATPALKDRDLQERVLRKISALIEYLKAEHDAL